jgi:hypothetical protein
MGQIKVFGLKQNLEKNKGGAVRNNTSMCSGKEIRFKRYSSCRKNL